MRRTCPDCRRPDRPAAAAVRFAARRQGAHADRSGHPLSRRMGVCLPGNARGDRRRVRKLAPRPRLAGLRRLGTPDDAVGPPDRVGNGRPAAASHRPRSGSRNRRACGRKGSGAHTQVRKRLVPPRPVGETGLDAAFARLGRVFERKHRIERIGLFGPRPPSPRRILERPRRPPFCRLGTEFDLDDHLVAFSDIAKSAEPCGFREGNAARMAALAGNDFAPDDRAPIESVAAIDDPEP